MQSGQLKKEIIFIVLHHTIARGIERKNIFADGVDRDDFLNRLVNILTETQTACFSWALIPNPKISNPTVFLTLLYH
jgi:hypothetical protein